MFNRKHDYGKRDMQSRNGIFKSIFSVFGVVALIVVFTCSCSDDKPDADGASSSKAGGSPARSGDKTPSKEKDVYGAKIKELSAQIEAKSKEAETVTARLNEINAEIKRREPEISAEVRKRMDEEPIPDKFAGSFEEYKYQDCRMLIHCYKTNPNLFFDFCAASEACSSLFARNFRIQGLSIKEFVAKIKAECRKEAEMKAKRYLQDKSLWQGAWQRKWQEERKKAIKEMRDKGLERFMRKYGYKELSRMYFEEKKREYVREVFKDGIALYARQKTLLAEIKQMKSDLLLLEQKATWRETRKNIVRRAPAIINEKLDESYYTCKSVAVEKEPGYYEYNVNNASEWWKGVATLHNSMTGKNIRRKIEVMYGRDRKTGEITMIVTLKDERP